MGRKTGGGSSLFCFGNKICWRAIATAAAAATNATKNVINMKSYVKNFCYHFLWTFEKHLWIMSCVLLKVRMEH